MKYYYELDVDGKVLGRYARNQQGKTLTLLEEAPDKTYKWDSIGEEWVSDADKVSDAKKEEVAMTDSDYVRVIDDIIDVLITKGTIALTDLPEKAQDKYNERVTLRSQI